MWADTIPVRCEQWVVGVRVDTASAAAAVRKHYGDRVVDADALATSHVHIHSNYTIIAPHIVMGHGTLYRAGVAMTESRRMSKLLASLDEELGSLRTPPGMLRLIAVTHTVDGGVVLEPAWRQSGSPTAAHRPVPMWVDVAAGAAGRPGEPFVPLRGVVLVADDIVPSVLTEMVTPHTAEQDDVWLEQLTTLSEGGRLRVTTAEQLAQTLSDLSRS